MMSIPDIEIIEVVETQERLDEIAAWQAGAYDRAVAECEQLRHSAYQIESDPLFFKYQRDEDGVTKQAWLDKIEEIRQRYPMPEKS